MAGLWFFINALQQIIHIYLQSFMLISLIDLEKYPGQISKCKNKQRAIHSKMRHGRVNVFKH
jgi:hypothetical protein